MKANLHFHSCYSDGTQWPEEMVVRASNVNLKLIALTDHDTMQGVPSFLRICQENNIQGIPAVEIDCIDSIQLDNGEYFNFDMEILAYFPYNIEENKWFSSQTFSLVEKRREIRKERIQEDLEKIKSYFNSEIISYKNLLDYKFRNYKEYFENLPLSWSRSDLYNFLISLNIIDEKTLREKAKEKVIKNSSPYRYFKSEILEGSIKREIKKPKLTSILKIITKDNGFAVLPHPGHLFSDNISKIKKNEKNLINFLEICKELGLWGIEIYYYHENNDKGLEINNFVRKTANYLKLELTYGSDCHGKSSRQDFFENFWGDFLGFL